VPGGNLIRIKGIDTVKDYCTGNKQPLDFGGYHSYLYRRVLSKPLLLNYVNLIEPYINRGIKIRAEYDTVNIFTKDYTLYQEIQNCLMSFVINVTEPDNADELKTLLDSNKLVICDRYPHNDYQYKLYFKHNMPINVRTTFYNWVKKYQNNQIYINKGTENYLVQDKNAWGEHYLYLKDKKMITLVLMAAQGYIRKTEEFVLRSSINTI
jgi:hypothetical protein